MAESPPVHPLVQPIAFLLGTWRGEGEGGFPTIQSFKYGEEIKLWHTGKFIDEVDVFECVVGGHNLFGTEIMEFVEQRPLVSINLKAKFADEALKPQCVIVDLPVIAYSQRTWKAASGEPMHAESGYWRPKPDGTIEVVIAQSTGLAEVQKGSFDAEKKTVQLQSSLVGNASKVKDIGRLFEVDGEELRYTVEMAIHGHEQQPHLRAVLKKINI